VKVSIASKSTLFISCVKQQYLVYTADGRSASVLVKKTNRTLRINADSQISAIKAVVPCLNKIILKNFTLFLR